jgi:hypothetical protein
VLVVRRARFRVLAPNCAVALLAAAALVACGGDDGGTARSKPTSPPEDTRGAAAPSTTGGGRGGVDDAPACALIDQDDAAVLFGEDAVRAEDTSPTHVAPTCIWKNASGDETGKVSRLLQVRIWPGEQYYGEKLHPDAASFGEGSKSFVARQGPNDETVQIVAGRKTYDFSYSVVANGVQEKPDLASEFAKFEQLVHQAFNSR